jgi:hypothetical protein
MYVVMYRRYLTLSFAPALGVHLPQPIFTLVQTVALPLFVVLLAIGGPVATAIGLGIYLLWSSIQSMRISNHVWLAFIGAAVVTLSDPLEQVAEARLILGALYFISGLVKCNDEFLFTERSVARAAIIDQAANLKLPVPRFMLLFSPAVVAIAEVAAGVSLLVNQGVVLVFAVCVVLHFAFGIVGNFHFSLIALAFWHEALGGNASIGTALSNSWPWMVVAAIGGAIASYLLKSNLLDARDRTSRAGFAASAFLSAAFCAATTLTWASVSTSALTEEKWGAGVAVTMIVLLVNFFLLVFGVKSEWTYAMFSNVRPYGQARIFGFTPRWRAVYFSVTWEGNFPDALGDRLPEQVLARIKDSEHVFSAPVAKELKELSKSFGTPLTITPMVFDRATRAFIRHPSSDVVASGGPLWVAPIINRDPAATHMG